MGLPFDLNEMAMFVAVVKAGSFSGAARKMHIPKATISRKVAQLERSLTIRLLQRTTRRLSLTEAGSLYFERCSRILEDMDAANLAVTTLQSVPYGTLRFSASIVFGVAVVNRLLMEFLARYPAVSAEILLVNRNVDLLAERIDLAFRAGPLEDSSLVSRPIGSIAYWLCASPDYLAQYGAPTEPQDLTQHHCLEVVTANFSGPSQWMFKQGSHEVTVPIAARIRVNDHLFVKEIALQGQGIALVPDVLVREEVGSHRLVRLLPEWINQQREIYLVYPSEHHLTPKLRAFLDFIAEKKGFSFTKE